MNMTFKEKSAWGSLVALALVSYWFFPAAFNAATYATDPAGLVAISIGCIVTLIIIEAIYQSVIAAVDGDASDERDALINLKAERIAGYVLGIALFTLVARIIAVEALEWVETMGALTIAVWILFTLTVSEVAKLISQIAFYRFSA
ncbi:MAG: hypothetical protein KJO95_05155 [Gammaproteobacteria bacterium]|nr:hypothetical protein [Gammaproteobacteria bacterium]MBU2677335.1 hypothetical protein [Gammaproteobacteria bacterium]NNC58007.1 hypothetical protein [Woeseiaceae bacterium]NNL51066.1 hypothetical protein [Woeseiaceae bacterium]